jgi:predicted transposase YdaD
LLGNLKVVLEARETIEPEDRELIMQLSPLYLEKIQAAQLVGRQEGHQEGHQEGRREEGQALILRQLKRRVGMLSPEVEARVRALPLERLEELGEALLDFQSMADLEAWIAIAEGVGKK